MTAAAVVVVSIRAPAWGATNTAFMPSPTCRFQFALPHGERLLFHDYKVKHFFVSIRAPAWGATLAAGHAMAWRDVSIRAPAWGATQQTTANTAQAEVSIRAPAWGATLNGDITFNPDMFQFALPHGERPWADPKSKLPKLFQFALPHGERRGLRGVVGVVADVSIRAPAWGATNHLPSLSLNSNVSIRAPAWGATFADKHHQPYYKGFNSRSRMGSDCGRAKGRGRWRGFNSRSRMGSDQLRGHTANHANQFQFALPHGERPSAPLSCASWESFNSRSRMGSDAAVKVHLAADGSFNSRSRMGSDLT